MQFQDILARWPGPAHDSRIFNCSYVKLRYENKETRGEKFDVYINVHITSSFQKFRFLVG